MASCLCIRTLKLVCENKSKYNNRGWGHIPQSRLLCWFHGSSLKNLVSKNWYELWYLNKMSKFYVLQQFPWFRGLTKHVSTSSNAFGVLGMYPVWVSIWTSPDVTEEWCGFLQSLQMVGGTVFRVRAQPLPYVCCAVWPQLLTVSLNEQIKTCWIFCWTL